MTNSTEQATAKTALSYFPLPEARGSQKLVIEEVEKAFQSGKKIVILEAPVGSGKSAIALTFARQSQNCHIITPRKSLQDQYYEDFKDDLVLMKGRGAYPCTMDSSLPAYNKVIRHIKTGMVVSPRLGEDNCANAPCRNSKSIWEICTEKNNKPCPYQVAIEVAQESPIVVHNIHSFIFQTNFGLKFEKRDLMIIDEAHEIENTIRGFITKKMSVNAVLEASDIPDLRNVNEWCDFFLTDRFVPEETASDRHRKEVDETFQSERDEYINRVEILRLNHEYYGESFTVRRAEIRRGFDVTGTSFEFIPHSIGNAGHRYLFDYGDKVLLMSGTIYDKDLYCKCVGINPLDAYFIRIPSTFPVANRKIYLKPEYQVDTSHRMWEENFDEMIQKIQRILSIFGDAKGLIHVPSYDAMQRIANALQSPRIRTHDSTNLSHALQDFYASQEPLVFVSPVCQQGVDFKYDRARFQIVTRVPYANTSDPLMSYMVENDFNWYNYQALIVFGQMVGRVNRAEDDFGVTFLMDERFNRFISRNSKRLPRWLQQAFVYK
jgi:ATP-dependent DNA helicase DinG